jgi:hypothetical protein
MPAETRYLDYSGRDDALSGGVKIIPIRTPGRLLRTVTFPPIAAHPAW